MHADDFHLPPPTPSDLGDLLRLLATSLTVEDRRRWEDDLLARYAEATGHTVQHVRLGVRQHLLWWMALYANNLSRIDPADAAGIAPSAPPPTTTPARCSTPSELTSAP